MATVWKSLNSFNGKKYFDLGRFAILVLGQPITIPEKYVLDLWNKATFCATADGGTDSWYDFVSKLSSESLNLLKNIHPDLVSGDFDSVKPETLQRCKDNNVKVVETPDQINTDFTKALDVIWKETNGDLDNVIAVVDNSGRLDHIMSNINTLYRPHKHRLFLLGSDALTWLLAPGLHEIHIHPSLVTSQAACGLIPVGQPCTVSSTGLKWNLDQTKMEFGGLVSSSNTYSQDSNGIVTVETDHPLLWTMSLELDDNS